MKLAADLEGIDVLVVKINHGEDGYCAGRVFLFFPHFCQLYLLLSSFL